jgi:hypothetical protein
VSRDFAVVERFVHGDVARLLAGFGVIERAQQGRNDVVDVHEAALQRTPR